MPSLFKSTDMKLWKNGLVTLAELSRITPVLGGPEHRWCYGEEHDFSISVQEPEGIADRTQYEMCSRCNHVRKA